MSVVSSFSFFVIDVSASPLISILSHLYQQRRLPSTVVLVYASKSGTNPLESVLFLKRVLEIFAAYEGSRLILRLHLTSASEELLCNDHRINTANAVALAQRRSASMGFESTQQYRRIREDDLKAVIGSPSEMSGFFAYVCGPPSLTDWAMSILQQADGIDPERVLCEKWW